MTTSITGRCYQHGGAGRPQPTSPITTTIPRADHPIASLGHPVESVQSSPPPEMGGFFGKLRNMWDSASYKLATVDLIPKEMRGLRMASDFKAGLDTIKSPDAQQKIRELTERLLGSHPYESDLIDLAYLSNSSVEAIRDIYAYRDLITPGQGDLGRLLNSRERLIDNFGVTPDENGVVQSLPIHDRIHLIVQEGDPQQKFPTYWQSEDLVRLVEKYPENVDRIATYMSAHKTLDIDEDGNKYPAFDAQELEESFTIHVAISDGFL